MFGYNLPRHKEGTPTIPVVDGAERNFPTSPEDIESLQKSEEGFTSFPISWQLAHLGLTQEALASLKGKRVLDIGCGKTAGLVKYLRGVGIEAEGIDREVDERLPHLIMRNITGIAPLPGSIPRPDQHYDLVLANSVIPIKQGLSSFVEYCCEKFRKEMGWNRQRVLDEQRRYTIEGTFILLEGLRTMKWDGKFVVYPALDRMNGLQSLVPDVNIVHERVPGVFPSEFSPYSAPQCIFARTTLTYKK